MEESNLLPFLVFMGMCVYGGVSGVSVMITAIRKIQERKFAEAVQIITTGTTALVLAFVAVAHFSSKM